MRDVHVIDWPAVIKFHGEDELSFVRSSDELMGHPDLLDSRLDPEDVLIDSGGKAYRLPLDGGPDDAADRIAEILSLDSIVELVRRHAAVRGECCIGKISAPGISAAIALIGAMDRSCT